jgi:hypothetical protein
VIRPLVALVATVLVATALGHAFVAATVADHKQRCDRARPLKCP